MSYPRRRGLCGAAVALLMLSLTVRAVPVWAAEWSLSDAMADAAHTNEAGFTLGDVLNRNLWTLARHPFAADTLRAMSDTVHQPPRRGIQFELLTPGDFGATLHIRW